jgi:hypothetical protein
MSYFYTIAIAGVNLYSEGESCLDVVDLVP